MRENRKNKILLQPHSEIRSLTAVQMVSVFIGFVSLFLHSLASAGAGCRDWPSIVRQSVEVASTAGGMGAAQSSPQTPREAADAFIDDRLRGGQIVVRRPTDVLVRTR
jgi:hypothetical protein